VGVSLSEFQGGWSLKLITHLPLMPTLKMYGIVSTITHMLLCLGFYLNTKQQQIRVFLVNG
jgi:hypothetical protein